MVDVSRITFSHLHFSENSLLEHSFIGVYEKIYSEIALAKLMGNSVKLCWKKDCIRGAFLLVSKKFLKQPFFRTRM